MGYMSTAHTAYTSIYEQLAVVDRVMYDAYFTRSPLHEYMLHVQCEQL
jgi:hypothetical protein